MFAWNASTHHHRKPVSCRLRAASKSHLLGGLLLIAMIVLALLLAYKLPEHKLETSMAGAQIAINPQHLRGTIPATAFGMNTAVWDGNLLDTAVPGLLRQAGITMLRFPGGSIADVYHWEHNAITPGRGYSNPNNTFDAFMGVVQHTGAQAFITVNYGSNIAGTGGGDPAEAAAWVRYANITRHYGITYWEIGNEVYGNGTYSGQWEADLHPTKGPDTYARNVLQYARMMKAVDPSIKIGVALTIPDTHPAVKQSPMASWNRTILSMTCKQIDFVDIHWYPDWHEPGDYRGTDTMLLASTSQIPAIMSRLRSEISRYCGTHARDIQILVGETNTGNPGKQQVSLVNALFLADSYMTWLENGAANVSWWDLHNGIETNGNNRPSLFGTANYGDVGVLANGTCAAGVCEPPANTPFPPYYGLQMLTIIGAPGDRMATAASQQRLVSAHAVMRANGNIAILLINKDASTSYAVSLALSGYTPASRATVYSYGMQSTAISWSIRSGASRTFTQIIPPYSLTTIILTPGKHHP
jgi:hypothetical protein